MGIMSVVTVCYNAEKEIEKTIQSVFELEGCYEYIIKDGNSSDRTNLIVDSYKKKFEKEGKKIIHIIEKDEGIYDAMNKSIAFCKGDWIIFMNAGDCFFLSKLPDLSNFMSCGVVYGDSQWRLADGAKYIYQNFHEGLRQGRGLNTQACFFNRKIFEKNVFDTKYKILGDYEFYLKLLRDNISFKKLNQIIVSYDLGGVSTVCHYTKTKEFRQISREFNLPCKQKKIGLLKTITLKIKEVLSIHFLVISNYIICFKEIKNTKKF